MKTLRKMIAALCLTIPLILTAQINPDTVLSQTIQQFAHNQQVTGVAAAVYYQGKNYYYNLGTLSQTNRTPITQNSLFEIASVTKLFTSSLLGVCVVQGKCQLNDPLPKYFISLQTPSAQGAPISQITLQELATHTASLPRDPAYFNVSPNQPNALQMLHYGLLNWQPAYPIGSQYVYSNLSFELLGDAMSNAFGLTYDNALDQFILNPLQMNHTFWHVPASMMGLMVTGYKGLQPTNYITFNTLPGGGALFSSANDLLTFLKANMNIGNISPSLYQALSLCQKLYFPVNPNFGLGLGWEYRTQYGMVYYTKNGSLPGFKSYVAMMPSKKIAVVILANQVNSTPGAAAKNILFTLAGT